MTRIRTAPSEGRQPTTWQQTVVERIRAGKLAPILSSTVDDDLALGGHAELVKAYAKYSHIPPNGRSLAEIAQFKGITDEGISDPLALKEDYAKFVKSRLYELAEAGGTDPDALAAVDVKFDDLKLAQICEQLRFPGYGDPGSHPLLLLANLELPIYLTTSCHEFLEAALVAAGKQPRTDFCRWHKNIESTERYPTAFDGRYEPSKQEPLVYHLHGLDRYEDSLVLTEDDYLTFLVACSQNIGKNSDPVHGRIRQALSDSSLLLLGYELSAWDFRSLFWGLIVPRTRTLTSVVCIQLPPSEEDRNYLVKYLDNFDFKVSWDRFGEYVAKLSEEVRGG